jgi:hypothetical protein
LRKEFPSHIKVEKNWKAMDGRRDGTEDQSTGSGQGTGEGQGTGDGGQNPKDDDLEPNYSW